MRLARDDWQQRRSDHRRRLGPIADDRIDRNGAKHPVYDFLFVYYAFRPSHILRWSPGPGVLLEGQTLDECDWPQHFVEVDGGTILHPESLGAQRHAHLGWAIEYLEAVAAREPSFHCFGWHEWAMVYRTADVRHGQYPLRLGRTDTDRAVEAANLRCTHFDAFRFFAADAVSRNRWPLTRNDSAAFDQPGCIHATMDLYKFAYKLAPYVDSDLLADALELAIAAREIDMRASPYDLSSLGFAPICVETREGREEYAAVQQTFFHRSVPIRQRLIERYREIASAVGIAH